MHYYYMQSVYCPLLSPSFLLNFSFLPSLSVVTLVKKVTCTPAATTNNQKLLRN